MLDEQRRIINEARAVNPAAVNRGGLDAGKMLPRIDPADPAAVDIAVSLL